MFVCVFVQLEILYIEALYTIKHKIGTTSEHHLSEVQDLFDYVRQAFDLSLEDHDRLLLKVNEEKVCDNIMSREIWFHQSNGFFAESSLHLTRESAYTFNKHLKTVLCVRSRAGSVSE